jgi:PAS domain S-box-containing protein
LVKDHAANDEEAVIKDKPFSQQIKTVRRSLHALRRRLTAKAGGRVPRVEPAAGLDEVGKTLDAAALEFSHLRAELAAARAKILERGRAEEALAAERNLLRTLIDSLPDRIYIKDVESRFLLNNIAHLQALGARSQEEAAGKTDYDYRPPDLADRYFADDQHVIQTGEPLINREEPTVLASGERGWLLVSKVPTRDPEGKITGLMGISRDITERRQAEVALQQEQALFNNLASTIPDLIYFKDRQSRFVRINEAMVRFFGLRSAPEVVGKTDFDFFSEEHAWQAYEDEQRVMSTGEPLIGLEEKETWPDGHVTWASTTKVPLRDADGNITGLVGISRNITGRRRAEERIREQAALLDNANDAIYVTALDCTILYWNHGAERTYGWTSAEVLNRKTTELISPDPAATEALVAGLLKQGSWSGERRQITKSGGMVEVFSRLTLVRNEQGQPQSVFAINTDITEKKQLEGQFLRAQRLESIGALASGIAHDLNNVLAPILIGAPLLREMMMDETARHLLKTMESSAQRGADIVRQVLTFARGVEGERVPLQPRHLLREMEKLAAETFPKSIRVESDVAADLWPVLGDATQLQQALMNLCINARDAMPGGGVLTLAAANIVLSKEAAEKMPGAQPGSYACLRVTDTGTGISPEIEAKIFEPFFTTKGVGKGTGLGLSTVLGIVRSHGGFVRVASKVGQGSTFELYLPATTEQVAVKSDSATPWPHTHGEGILVVDDEAAVREVARQALMEFGYQVITAGRGAEALRIFQERRPEIQLVLTDMMMPEMDGPTLVAALRVLDPAVRIVGITGMSDTGSKSGLKTLALSAMLAKPFTIKKLLAVIRDALPVTAGHERAAPDGGDARPAPPG